MDKQQPGTWEHLSARPQCFPNPASAPRLFVDLTTSLMLVGFSPMGVARVEAEIARRLLARPALRPVAVAFDESGTMFALGEDNVEAILGTRPAQVAPRLRIRRTRTEDAAPSRAADAAASVAHALPSSEGGRSAVLRLPAGFARMIARNGVRMLPEAVREDARAILIHGRQIVRTAVYGRRPTPVAPASEPAPEPVPVDDLVAGFPQAPVRPTLRAVVHPRPGDVLWTAGLQHEFTPMRRLAEMDRYRGMPIAAVFYDLIRLTHPEFNPSSRSAGVFEAAAIDLLRAASHIMAISSWSRTELLSFAERAGLAPPRIDVIRLGANLPGMRAREDAALAYDVTRLVGAGRFALAVGTVEPRKNYGLLVRVWESLVADPEFDLDLVVVGAAGHGVEKNVDELEQSPLFGSRIKWIEGASDEVLAALYRAADMVLSPSFVEGWGLPITEALAFGRPVIASNRGAQPEAAMGRAILLDPQDDAAWASAVREVARGAHQGLPPLDPPDWDGCADTIAQALAALMTAPAGA